jgi:hypothetical protein
MTNQQPDALLDGIPLLPKGQSDKYSSRYYVKDGFTLDCPFPKYAVDGDLWCRMSSALTSIVGPEQRSQLRLGGILSPLALIMTEIYVQICTNYDPVAEHMLQDIKEICKRELQKPVPNNIEGMLMVCVNNFALKTMQPCGMRLDEYGQSVCEGEMAVSAEFFSTQILGQSFGKDIATADAAVRVWFRHGRFLVTIDLAADEVWSLGCRISFPGQLWGSGFGKGKDITRRAEISVGPYGWALVLATEEKYDMTQFRTKDFPQ